MEKTPNRNDRCPCGSRKKYKQCHLLLNEARKNGSSSIARLAGSVMDKRIFVHDYGPQSCTFAHIIAACRNYDVFEALTLIRQISVKLADNDFEPGPYLGTPPTLVTQASLAGIARCLLLGGANTSKRHFTMNDCASLLRLYWRLREPLADAPLGGSAELNAQVPDIQAGDKIDLEAQQSIELHLSRALYLDAPWQKERRHVLPRSLLLFNILEENLPTQPVTQYLRERLGMDVYEWMLLAKSVWSWSRAHSGRISAAAITQALKKYPRTTSVASIQKIDLFLQHMSATRSAYCGMAGRWETDELKKEGMAKYSFNPLFKNPIIKLDEPRGTETEQWTHVEPMEWLLLEAATYGNYFLITEKSGGSVGKAFGRNFELYVGKLLRECLPESARLYEEEEYTLEHLPYRSADWTLIEGNAVTLIECKLANLRMSGKMGIDYSSFVNDMDKLIEAIEQSNRFKVHALTHPARWNHLSQVTSFHHLIVIYDQQYFGNFAMRRAILPRLNDALRNTVWHVINIDELEYLFQATKRKTLASILEHKASREEFYEMDFREYLIRTHHTDEYVNPMLEALWLRYFAVESV